MCDFKLILATLIVVSVMAANGDDNPSSSTPFSIARRIRPDASFQPKYMGKIIFRHKLNLTESAKKIKVEPDYYAAGEGPESGEDEDLPLDEDLPPQPAIVRVPVSTTPKPRPFSFSKFVTPGPNFKPKYSGRIIHRHELNLTDSAKLIKIKPEYYDDGEGPEDDDEDELYEDKIGEVEAIQSISTKASVPTTTTTTTTTVKPFMISKYVTVGPDFKPKYQGKITHRHELNITDSAKKVLMKPDYYDEGEGPEDDDDDLVMLEPSSTTTTTTTTTTTSSPPVTSTTEKRMMFSKFITPGPSFKPKYKGKIIHRDQLNLTETAKKIKTKSDYYDEGEGPEDDDTGSAELDETPAGSEEKTTSSTPAPASSTASSVASAPTEKSFMFSKFVTPGPNFKPKYKGRIIHRDELNLTDTAKKIKSEPDYYDSGEGPDDDSSEDDEAERGEVKKQEMKLAEPESPPEPTEASASTSSASPVRGASNSLLFSKFVTPPPGFKPKYNGRIIHRDELNLTDTAKKITNPPEYYDEGEGPEDEDDGESKENDEGDKAQIDVSTTSTTTTTVTQASEDRRSSQVFADEDKELSDIDMAVGGISGIVEKILAGPKKNELTNTSKPEEVYAYLQNIISDETTKAFKATLPRIYDYQFPILNVVSQRCFNSFAQFGDRFRHGFVWPMQMMASSASFSLSNQALRDYGDFDRCLDVIADDGDRKRNEEIFTGQYCMMKVLLPLPPIAKNLTYWDKVLNFDNLEVSGSLSKFLSANSPFLYSNPLSMGLCLPSTCSPREIEDVLHLFLKKFHIQVQVGADCYSKLNLTPEALPGDISDLNITTLLEQSNRFSFREQWANLTIPQTWALCYIVLSVVFVIFATMLEMHKVKSSALNSWTSNERNRPKSFFVCFSARHNILEILHSKDRYTYELTSMMCSDSQASDISILPKTSRKTFLPLINTSSVDGLKVFALIWICLANFFFLGYQTQMLPSVAHVRDVLHDMKQSALAQVFVNSWLSFEIFFLLSGFLFAYTSLPYISRHDGRPNLLFFLGKRVVRFLPSIILLILTIHLLPLWSNAGPLYNSSVEKLLEPCKRFYWRSLFFTSNIYRHNETCLPQLWYVSMEMQLSILAAFVTVFAYNRSKHALKAFALFIVIGLAVPAYLAIVKKIKINPLFMDNAVLEDIPDSLKELHFNPAVHFVPYFLGLAIGFFSRTSCNFRFGVPKFVRFILWLVLPLLCLLAVFAPFYWPFKPSLKYESGLRGIYFGSYRLMFIAVFAWILYESLYNRATLVRLLLSFKAFRVVSHLSFQIFVVNLVVIWIYLFTKRHVLQDSFFENLCIAVTLFTLTVFISFGTYLLFEAPLRSLFRYYLLSPRTLSLTLPEVQSNQFNTSKPREEQSYKQEMNPHFLFSPHYNMITNVNSRDGSEAGSVYNFPTTNNNNNNPSLENASKHSIITVTPDADDKAAEINNNNTPSSDAQRNSAHVY